MTRIVWIEYGATGAVLNRSSVDVPPDLARRITAMLPVMEAMVKRPVDEAGALVLMAQQTIAPDKDAT